MLRRDRPRRERAFQLRALLRPELRGAGALQAAVDFRPFEKFTGVDHPLKFFTGGESVVLAVHFTWTGIASGRRNTENEFRQPSSQLANDAGLTDSRRAASTTSRPLRTAVLLSDTVASAIIRHCRVSNHHLSAQASKSNLVSRALRCRSPRPRRRRVGAISSSVMIS